MGVEGCRGWRPFYRCSVSAGCQGGEGLDSCSSEARFSGGRVLSEDIWIVVASWSLIMVLSLKYVGLEAYAEALY